MEYSDSVDSICGKLLCSHGERNFERLDESRVLFVLDCFCSSYLCPSSCTSRLTSTMTIRTALLHKDCERVDTSSGQRCASHFDFDISGRHWRTVTDAGHYSVCVCACVCVSLVGKEYDSLLVNGCLQARQMSHARKWRDG